MNRLIRRPIPCQDGDTVVIGLSGGADSVSLVYALKQEYPALCLAACHLNHGLRGQESDRDEQFVRDYCEALGVTLFCRRENVREISRQTGESLEECGRRLRYDFFNETADMLQQRTSKMVWIATAHNASDQAETMLFRLVRGSGTKGLCGIPERRGRILRPLLFVGRKEIESYCQTHNLFYVTDSSNLCDDYTRNRIRHQIVPQLRKINPSFEREFLQTADILTQEEDFWEHYITQQYHTVRRDIGLDISQLEQLHPAVLRRVLLVYLRENGLTGTFEQVQQSLQVLYNGKKCNIKKGFFLQRCGNLFCMKEEKIPCPYFEFPFSEGMLKSRTGQMYKIQILDTNPFAFLHKIYKNMFDILLDCGKICGSITVRQRKSGDRIKLYSSAGTKTLKKLMNETHIPVDIRDRLFVLTDDLGVIAVEGLGVAERVRCDPTTTKWIQIKPVKGTSNDER
jgi:tRNA(Ile)-lysidine synthase